MKLKGVCVCVHACVFGLLAECSLVCTTRTIMSKILYQKHLNGKNSTTDESKVDILVYVLKCNTHTHTLSQNKPLDDNWNSNLNFLIHFHLNLN